MEPIRFLSINETADELHVFVGQRPPTRYCPNSVCGYCAGCQHQIQHSIRIVPLFRTRRSNHQINGTRCWRLQSSSQMISFRMFIVWKSSRCANCFCDWYRRKRLINYYYYFSSAFVRNTDATIANAMKMSKSTKLIGGSKACGGWLRFDCCAFDDKTRVLRALASMN